MKKIYDFWDIDKLFHKKQNFQLIEKIYKKEQMNNSINNEELFSFCCEFGHLNLAKILLKENKIDPSFDDHCSIKYATECNNLHIVKILIDLKLKDMESIINDCLIISCQYGLFDMTKFLIKYQTKKITIPIRVAAKFGHLDIVKLLFIQPKTNYNAAIIYAVRNKHQNVIDFLFNQKSVRDYLKLKYSLLFQELNQKKINKKLISF